MQFSVVRTHGALAIQSYSPILEPVNDFVDLKYEQASIPKRCER